MVDKSETRVRQMFGEIAPRYDLLNHLLSLNVDRYWRWRTVRLAPPQGLDPVLDVCTGTGDLALAYGRQAGGQLPVLATDFCSEMLEIAAAKGKKQGAAAVAFATADTQALPFADGTFQLVTVAFGLRNVSSTDRGLREMVRVCQAGGRVVILEFSMPQRQPLRFLYGYYFRRILPLVGQWMARNRQEAYHYLPASVGEFPSGRALVEQMESVGLQDVEYWPFTWGVCTLYIGQKPVPAAAPPSCPPSQHAGQTV